MRTTEIQQIPDAWPSWMKSHQIEHLMERRKRQLEEQGQKHQPVPERFKPIEIDIEEDDIVERLKRENRMLKAELKNVYERLSRYE